MISIYYDKFLSYPDTSPYHPPEQFPEFKHLGKDFKLDKTNKVFNSVRELFRLMELDSTNYGTERWNPLGSIINKGETVVIKPNLVLHEFGYLRGKHCLITDGSVIRAVLDYVAIAIGTTGKIIIADAPIQGGDFNLIKRQSGLDSIQDYCRTILKYPIEIIDLRREWAVLSEDASQILRRQKLEGDPNGYSTINLGEESFLQEICNQKTRFGVIDYDEKITNKHHKNGIHEYMISNTILNANCIINLPKLKTHRKAGITASLKNFVGINGSKDYLAHHRIGAPPVGDEFLRKTWFNVLFWRIRKLLNERAPHWLWKTVRHGGILIRKKLLSIQKEGVNAHLTGAGGWYGNDTVWRMIYDINRIFFYYDAKEKKITDKKQRKYLSIIDAIIAGEGDGPLVPIPRNIGLLIGGFDPFILDAVSAKIMGFDWKKIPFLREYYRVPELTQFSGEFPDNINSNDISFLNMNQEDSKWFEFVPPSGWKTRIEF